MNKALPYLRYHLFPQVVDLFVEGYKLFATAHGKSAGKRDLFLFLFFCHFAHLGCNDNSSTEGDHMAAKLNQQKKGGHKTQFHNQEQNTRPCPEARLSFLGQLQYFENMTDSIAACDFYCFFRPTLDSCIT